MCLCQTYIWKVTELKACIVIQARAVVCFYFTQNLLFGTWSQENIFQNSF